MQEGLVQTCSSGAMQAGSLSMLYPSGTGPDRLRPVEPYRWRQQDSLRPILAPMRCCGLAFIPSLARFWASSCLLE